jgi:hypothetical protein
MQAEPAGLLAALSSEGVRSVDPPDGGRMMRQGDEDRFAEFVHAHSQTLVAHRLGQSAVPVRPTEEATS